MSIIIGSAQLKPTQIDSKKTKWTHTRACIGMCECVYIQIYYTRFASVHPFYIHLLNNL